MKRNARGTASGTIPLCFVACVLTACGLICVDSDPFTLPGPVGSEFATEDVETVLRYLAGTGRWEVIPGEPTTVIRKEERDRYQPTLNGFYGSPTAVDGMTRILLSFGESERLSGFDCVSVISAARTGDSRVSMVKPKTGQPGYVSVTILDGEHLNIEVYEQNESKRRVFTETSLAEVTAEIRRYAILS